MDADPWARWRSLNGWPGSIDGAGAVPHRGAGITADFAPGDFAGRFDQAARVFLGAGAETGRAGAPHPPDADAARRFGDAVRDLFSSLQPLQFGAAPADATDGVYATPHAHAFGATREHQLRWHRLTEAGRQLAEAQGRLQRLWLDALREAATAFSAGLARPSPAAGDTAVTIRRLYDSWIDCAENAYARVAHGSAFCEALADAVNSGSRWRHELKALVEESAKPLDLPTRSELNALQQRLRAVEAELRETRQRADTAASKAPRPEPPAAAPATPRTPSRPRKKT